MGIAVHFVTVVPELVHNLGVLLNSWLLVDEKMVVVVRGAFA